METRRPPHYIITVHGIGEQKENETSLEVVQRFAEVRQGKLNLPSCRALLPANLSSYSVRRKGHGPGWSEFGGIPVDPTNSLKEAFDGTRASTSAGKNFRFVDLRWADILQSHQPRFSSPVEAWTGALLHRLKPPFTPSNWSKEWLNPLLHEVAATVIPFKRILSWYKPLVANLIFDRILGDVHLYGDYARTRGQAVRRFHATLDQIHLRDYEQWCRFERTGSDEQYTPPSYTIIAHSLGSIMSFDALIYAFAKLDIRAGKTPHVSGSLPFPGYTEHEECEELAWDSLIGDIKKHPARSDLPRGEENLKAFKKIYPQLKEEFPRVPPLLWRNNVSNFITLGSPIDKFHVLWHQNYRHMGLMHHDFEDEWSEDWLEKDVSARIPHYNLCDEQDPVGHHLEEAQGCQNYKKVFDTSIPLTYRDVVFRRYPVPGAAHTQYWKDRELFEILIHSIIDSSTAGSQVTPLPFTSKGPERFVQESFMEVPGCYRKALEWAYFRIPLITAIVTGLLLSYGIIEWHENGFALSYFSAILAAVLLWVMPRPSKGYQKEATHIEATDEEQTSEQEVDIPEEPVSLNKNNWLERWKPRPSLFANLVRGAVTWRRILIWLNRHPNQAFTVQDALRDGVRLSLKSSGQFKKHVVWRVLVGFLVMGLTSSLVIGDWQPTLVPNALSPYLLNLSGWLYVPILVTFIISVCYLAVMAYVGVVFKRMKQQMLGESSVKKEHQTDSHRSHKEVMDHRSAANFK